MIYLRIFFLITFLIILILIGKCDITISHYLDIYSVIKLYAILVFFDPFLVSGCFNRKRISFEAEFGLYAIESLGLFSRFHFILRVLSLFNCYNQLEIFRVFRRLLKHISIQLWSDFNVFFLFYFVLFVLFIFVPFSSLLLSVRRKAGGYLKSERSKDLGRNIRRMRSQIPACYTLRARRARTMERQRRRVVSKMAHYQGEAPPVSIHDGNMDKSIHPHAYIDYILSRIQRMLITPPNCLILYSGLYYAQI